jgi:calcineurin-like phosphoesterase family protein
VLAALVVLAGCGGDDERVEPPERPGAAKAIAVGDIAVCGAENDEATAELVAAEPEATLLALGDNAYFHGLKDEYESCYGPAWGAFKDRTRPVPGNHDYGYFHKDAAAYFDYFGAAAGEWGRGYYSFDLGSWHLIALNSNCDAEMLGGCGDGSAQGRWLRQDLQENAKSCTLAYWHHPRFSAGEEHGSDTTVAPFWQALYEAGADVVLSAHEHTYQRFAPQDPSGEPDEQRGIREFVVGTGGGELVELGEQLPTTEVQNDETFGVLQLTLFAGGYDWEFEPAGDGEFTDRGSGRCH